MDDVEILECPTCGNEQDEAECYLGQLGRLTHYRCRYCGMGFSYGDYFRSGSNLGGA